MDPADQEGNSAEVHSEEHQLSSVEPLRLVLAAMQLLAASLVVPAAVCVEAAVSAYAGPPEVSLSEEHHHDLVELSAVEQQTQHRQEASVDALELPSTEYHLPISQEVAEASEQHGVSREQPDFQPL